MRLNGSALNARTLNGGARLPVFATGEAISGLAVELDATRVTFGEGAAVHELFGEFRATAQRFGGGDWQSLITADIAQTVARGGQGAAVLDFDAGLFYSKVSLGFGSAEIGLHLQGHVGIVFGDGQAAMLPMAASMDGARVVSGAGGGSIEIAADLSPSAIRRFAGIAMPLALQGDGEGSHIDSEGARHLGFAGNAQIQVGARDAGMLRQSFIGSLDFDLQGSGSGALEKPTLAGSAVMSLGLSSEFRVIRRGHGAAPVTTAAMLSGEIFVRGEGAARLGLIAACTGYRVTFPKLESVVTGIDSRLDGQRISHIDGVTHTELIAGLTGTLVRNGRSNALLALLAESDAYLNPLSDDQSEQIFTRPASPRIFARPASVREWRR